MKEAGIVQPPINDRQDASEPMRSLCFDATATFENDVVLELTTPGRILELRQKLQDEKDQEQMQDLLLLQQQIRQMQAIDLILAQREPDLPPPTF